MRTYILKRLLLMIPTMIAITTISFIVIQSAPGDPAKMAVRKAEQAGAVQEGGLSDEVIAQARKLYGLDKPLWKRYVLWLGDLAHGDFGYSYKDNRPVADKIVEVLPVTLQLNILAILIVYLVAVPAGVYSAVRQGTVMDQIVTLGFFILYSLPSFWAATMLLKYLAGGEGLDLFPVYGFESPGYDLLGPAGRLWDRLWHLVLPVTCLAYGGFASLSRFQRAGMLEVIRQDYITTARAKGLTERVVLLKHALRPSLIPMVTLFAGLLPSLIGGSIIIESIFSLPGMGKLSFEAVLSRDYPVVMALLTISAVLTLLGILLSDILYVIVDPRISFD
ncbi:MAG: ABC transporter permease [Myxococcales bacterium]|nr:ABC transporter permease [Myxococcales bacterium]